MNQPLLSIVLPTYNRAEYLSLTLKSFKSQLERNHDRVSFRICDNASTDGTEVLLENIHKECTYFEWIHFKEHVDVGYSIVRANNTATGEYVLMWGDDDIPAPYFLDTVLDYIEVYNHPDLIHYNRLYGYDDQVENISKLSVLNRHVGESAVFYNSVNDFLEAYSLDITFLSAIIFRRDRWMANKCLDTRAHYGYEFLGKILHGIKGRIVYIQYPLCIQRKPFNRPWMNKSPYYRFLGIPNMYQDFEKWGLVRAWKELWAKRGNAPKDFLSIMAQTSLFKKEYKPLYRDMIKYQYSFSRKLLTFCFVYLMPGWVYKGIRHIAFRG